MSFIDSYKRLEKICSEIYGDNHSLSIYIDEMIGNPNGSYYVSGWNEDLRQLKHYRWVRNQIVHEPECTEESMCDPDDIQWLDNFYSRIMSTNDPLTLYSKVENQLKPQKSKEVNLSNSTMSTNDLLVSYHKVEHQRGEKNFKKTYSSNQSSYKPKKHSKKPSKSTELLIVLMGVIFLFAAVIFILIMYR